MTDIGNHINVSNDYSQAERVSLFKKVASGPSFVPGLIKVPASTRRYWARLASKALGLDDRMTYCMVRIFGSGHATATVEDIVSALMGADTALKKNDIYAAVSLIPDAIPEINGFQRTIPSRDVNRPGGYTRGPLPPASKRPIKTQPVSEPAGQPEKVEPEPVAAVVTPTPPVASVPIAPPSLPPARAALPPTPPASADTRLTTELKNLLRAQEEAIETRRRIIALLGG